MQIKVILISVYGSLSTPHNTLCEEFIEKQDLVFANPLDPFKPARTNWINLEKQTVSSLLDIFSHTDAFCHSLLFI